MLSRFTRPFRIPRTILATYLVSRCPRQTLVSRLMLSSRPMYRQTPDRVHGLLLVCYSFAATVITNNLGQPSRRQDGIERPSTTKKTRSRGNYRSIVSRRGSRRWLRSCVSSSIANRGIVYIVVRFVEFRRKDKGFERVEGRNLFSFEDTPSLSIIPPFSLNG